MKMKKRLLGILLTLALVLGLMPGMSLTALAATNTYTNLIPTDSDTDLSAKQVTFNGIDWYVIKDESTAADAGTVTLFAKDPLSASLFDGTPNGNGGYTGVTNKYSSATRSSTVKGVLDALTAGGGSFEGVADVIQSVDLTDVDVTGAKLWLLSTDEASDLPVNIRKCAQASGAAGNVFWLRSPSPVSGDFPNVVGVDAESGNVIVNGYIAYIMYGVRPALKLDLSKVTFDSETKTFSLAPVSYRAASVNAETHEVTFTDASCAEYTVVSTNTTAFEDGKWYVVTTSKEITQRIEVEGTANLILVDGKTLTATKGITVTTGNALNIYAQSEDDAMGQIIINGVESSKAGIGGDSAGVKGGGNITINGGNINVTGGNSAAGIGGGGNGGEGGELTINGGIVSAFGGSAAAGIGGGGSGGEGGKLTINGGIVTAVGGSKAAGIGGGAGGNRSLGGNGGTVTINGGTVNATGGGDGAMGIGGGSGGKGNGDHGDLTLGTGMWILVSTDNSNWSVYDGSTRTQYMKTYLHTHDFTYSADGATITATCGAEDCGLTDSKTTLTIVAPTMTVYQETGKSEVASLTGLQDFNTATGKSLAVTNIMYVGRDGTEYTESTTAPTNAGKYTATITLSGVKTSAGDNQNVTASVDYEIAKAATTVSTAPTAGEITYGKTLADSALTGGTASVAGTFAWKNTTIAPAVSDSETTEYDVVFTPTDGNYSTAECKVKLTVNKANPTNTVEQLSAFVGQTLAEVALPTAENGVWNWEDDTTTTLNELGMTTHFAKFTPNDTNNYNTLENVSVQIEVAEKPMAVPATVTANNRTYDGTEKPLVNVDNSTLVGGTMQYALGTATEATEPYTTSIPTGTDAGTYYVWYMAKGDENHNDSEVNCIPVTITIPVTSVTLNADSTTIAVNGVVALTATVSPNNATDKKVIWSVGAVQTRALRRGGAAVKLYKDAACTEGNEVGTEATDTLTVYAKGVELGEATVTVTSNENSNRYAICTVSVQDIPHTGDTADFGLWAALLLAGLSGMGIALTAGKHRKARQ